MQSITVNLKQRSYSIDIERGAISTFADRHSKMDQVSRWMIITQPNLVDDYGTLLLMSMKKVGLPCDLITVPCGESAKSISQIEKLYRQLLSNNCDRNTLLIALGGGVVGDVTGFVASTYMRGIKYIQFPTTLLAMIDSSIGGKTGVNLLEGKNLVGAIYQPKKVIIDPNLLDTLPKREKVSGFAEMLKYGLIRDKEFFRKISDGSLPNNLNDESLLEESIARSCKIKANIVATDEYESGLRRILNFGHTIGHAFETLTNDGVLRHGEAVAYGMLCSGYISFKKGLISKSEWNEIEGTLRKLSLPKFDIPDHDEILKTIRHDKKNYEGKLHFVLLDGIGNAITNDSLSDQDIVQSLEVL